MATVPSGTRFIGISENVNLTERKSAVLNAETQPYTIQDIADTVGVGAQGPQGVQGPAGPIGPVGPAGLNWQGAWVSGTSYVADDAVGYDGASWFCILATSGTTTPDVDTTHWALLASQGAQGPQGVQGPTGAQGPSGGAGTLQQTVNNGNTIADGYNTMTVTANSIKTNTSLGGQAELVGSTSPSAKPFLKFGLSASAGKTVTLTHADTQAASRTIKLPDASGTVALTSDVTLQKAINGGNTITDGVTTMTVLADSIKTNDFLGGKIELVSTAGNNPFLKIGLPSSAGKTVTLTSADSQTASRTIKLPDADGTVALKTYNETVILLSYDGTRFTYTNVINELGVTITFSTFSGIIVGTLSSSVLTADKTIIWASSFVEFGGYLTQALRANGTSFTLALTNTNGTNNTIPTSFNNIPIRIQVYN